MCYNRQFVKELDESSEPYNGASHSQTPLDMGDITSGRNFIFHICE